MIKNIYNNILNKRILIGNTLLFINILLLLSGAILFAKSNYNGNIIRFLFNLLLFTAAFTIKTDKLKIFFISLATIAISELYVIITQGSIANYISEFSKIIFFFIIVYKLISQLAKSKNVTSIVIFEAINVYLLIGIIGTLFAVIISLSNPNAFTFSTIQDPVASDYFYYSYITLTTIGYGDITPISQEAKLLTILLGIGGQFYVTLILAMIVGKYLSKK
ncbi:two pore domain potassium channel family protein [Labilibacter sediminis]|nr:two pore domain potassium channel family protein [Labilibacter sediminis]